MRSIIIVGNTGTGKTTLVKKLLSTTKTKKLIYDINNEYTGQQNDFEFSSFEVFLSAAASTNNSMIVFEEATIFFSNRGTSRETTEILVRKRHTNNACIFVFHSLRAIPLHILDLSDFLFLFKTGDAPTIVERKFDGRQNILTAFNSCAKSVNKHICQLVKLR